MEDKRNSSIATVRRVESVEHNSPILIMTEQFSSVSTRMREFQKNGLENSHRTEQLESITRDLDKIKTEVIPAAVEKIKEDLEDTKNKEAYKRLKSEGELLNDHWVVIRQQLIIVQTKDRKEALARVRKGKSRCLLLCVGHEEESFEVSQVDGFLSNNSWCCLARVQDENREIEVTFKIDTGASLTTLTKTILDQLQSESYTTIQCHGAFDNSYARPLYILDVELDGKVVNFVECVQSPYNSLLGMNVLKEYTLTMSNQHMLTINTL